MAYYCTYDDLLEAMDENDVLRYTDDDEDGVPDDGVIDLAFKAATGLIDTHVAKRYGTGISPVPDLLNSLAVDIVVYKISSRKGLAPDEARKRYDDAIRMLEKIMSGKADIPGVTINEETVTDDKTAAVVSPPRNFTDHGMDRY